MPPNTTWIFCQVPASGPPVFANRTDLSIVSGPGSQPVIPGVIERTGNVILGHGAKDFLVLPDATLLTIQNLTWNGEMGFRETPAGVLFVPGHNGDGDGGGGEKEAGEAVDVTGLTGAGVVGSSHEERGLTWFGATMAGHLVALDQPAVAFRMVEVLLGRVEGFESTVPFTVDMGTGWQSAVGQLGTRAVEDACEEED